MSSKNYYVNGNTVRELDTPVRHNQRTRKEIEEARRRKNRRNAARRNRQRAMEMSRGYVVFLTACVVITALTAVLFVRMQSQMTKNKETENKEIKIILEAETSSQNIFAPIVFYQSFDFGKDAPCLSEVYDSIVWKSSHSPNSFKVFSHSNYARYVETTFFKWAHVYYSPGTYKTYLLGYKNNEIIYSSDTISIDITNKKDFLAFNWKDVTDSDFTTGYANNLDGYYLSTQTHIHQGVPSVMLYAKNEKYEKGGSMKSKQILYNYINSFFSLPNYTATSDESLRKEFSTIFSFQEKNAIPLNIWLTSKAKIVLLRKDFKGLESEYKIYAEPGDLI